MRYRWWYYGTGVPGWMRFGPGRGGGGPCARYAMADRWPAPYETWGSVPRQEVEVSALKAEADRLKAQLDAVTKRLEQLGGEE
jgi:hypothetical protein